MAFRIRPRYYVVLISFAITPLLFWVLLEKDVCSKKSNVMLLHVRLKMLESKLDQIAIRIKELKPRIIKMVEGNIEQLRGNVNRMKEEMEIEKEKPATVDTTNVKNNMVRNDKNIEELKTTERVTPNKQALPEWIETFVAPHWSEFKPWRGVFVFFIAYRHLYLKACLNSIANATAYIEKDSVCVFALDRVLNERQRKEVEKTVALIKNVTFCKVFIWDVNSDGGKAPEENRARRLKHHWWFVLGSIFNATVKGDLFDGLLRGYKTDILFIEEDAVFSPDFVQVMWFLSSVKRLNNDIIQTALGGWSGENMINAHPDTFIVRTSRTVRGIAYGLNQTTWFYFKSLEKEYFEDDQDDWCESMGLVLGKNNNMTGFRIVIPTLSRIWHIGKWGLGLGGDFEWERPVTTQPNWAYATRLLELKNIRVNLGLRDILGFLCKTRESFWYLENVTCPNALTRWNGLDRNRIMCAKQPYVEDPCDVYIL